MSDIPRALDALRLMAKQRHDGLRMFRSIGPDLSDAYNDQTGVLECRTTETFVGGGNRAGKTTPVVVKIAAAARDVPVLTWDGREIDCRHPHQKGRPLVIWIVGLQQNHIGQTIHRLLFRSGAYRIIPDYDTGVWRAYRPWDEKDVAREALCRPSKPLIPYTEIEEDSWVWDNAAARVFESVRLKNGTEIYAFASTADVKQGDAVDIIWLDERIARSDHYPEWMMRLTDRQGWLIWSSMIRNTVPAMSAVIDRAEAQSEEVRAGERPLEKLWSRAFFFRQDGNPFLPNARVEQNREFLEGLGEEELAMRADGVAVHNHTAIYPFFDKHLHCAIPADKAGWDDLATLLHKLGGMPPDDWTHELILDPGTQRPGVLFCAIPPKHWTDRDGKTWSLWADAKRPFYVPYDEIYTPRTPAGPLAKLVREKMRGIRFRRFIVDGRAARQTPMGASGTVASQYSAAFAEEGVESAETGNGFVVGDPDFSARSKIVESWMQVLQCGFPQLRIVVDRCPNLVWQLARNQRALDGEVVLDKEARKERNDIRVCLEYYASRHPVYVQVPQRVVNPEWLSDMRRWEDRVFGRNEPRQSERCHFGPGLAPTGTI